MWRVLQAEIGAIVAYEAAAYPLKGKPKKASKLPPRDEYSREKLEAAKLMILEESMEDPRAKAQVVSTSPFSTRDKASPSALLPSI